MHEYIYVSMHICTGVATGEDWSFRILNTLSEESCDDDACGGVDTVVAVYFVSFIALVQMISFNIIVAVLIQGFTLFMHEDDTSKRMQDEAREHHKNAGPMDPLLATLANFTSPQHLKNQIDLLFSLWDVDDSGKIDYEEMHKGLLKLRYQPPLFLSSEDWDSFIHHGRMVDADGALDKESFEVAMRFQLDEYSQRLLANKMLQSVKDEHEQAPTLFAMKMALLEIITAAQDRRQRTVERAARKLEAGNAGKHGPRPPTPGQDLSHFHATHTSRDTSMHWLHPMEAYAEERQQGSGSVGGAGVEDQRQYGGDTFVRKGGSESGLGRVPSFMSADSHAKALCDQVRNMHAEMREEQQEMKARLTLAVEEVTGMRTEHREAVTELRRVASLLLALLPPVRASSRVCVDIVTSMRSLRGQRDAQQHAFIRCICLHACMNTCMTCTGWRGRGKQTARARCRI